MCHVEFINNCRDIYDYDYLSFYIRREFLKKTILRILRIRDLTAPAASLSGAELRRRHRVHRVIFCFSHFRFGRHLSFHLIPFALKAGMLTLKRGS